MDAISQAFFYLSNTGQLVAEPIELPLDPDDVKEADQKVAAVLYDRLKRERIGNPYG